MAAGPDLTEIEAVLRDDGARTKLARWMVEHHDSFSAMLRQYGANWGRLTEKFVELGLVKADVRPTAVKATFYRTRRKLMASKQAELSLSPAPEHQPEPRRDQRKADDEIVLPPFRLTDWTKRGDDT